MSAYFTRLEFWISFVLLAAGLFWLARFRKMNWLPAWALRLLVLALALFVLFAPRGQFSRRPVEQPQVLVVDQSDSIPEEVRALERQQAQEWQSAGEYRMVISFGARSEVVPQAGQTWPEVDGRASDLAGALILAADLIGNAPGQVILATDGRARAATDVDTVIQRLGRQGVTLDASQLPTRDDPNDGAIGPLSVPTNLWAGTPFDLILPVYMPRNGGEVSLRLQINGQDSQAQAEALSGDYYRFRVPSLPEGIVTLQVTGVFNTAESQPDPFPANNSAFATLQVFAAPRVLFISETPASGKARDFRDLLIQNGIQVDTRAPDRIPTDLETLQDYQVIFLNDLLASQLKHEQMLSLQVFVSRLGGGLVFLGGRNSYTLGGYNDTLLEPMLPVLLQPPPRSERPPIVFLLILDRSSSMGSSSVEGAPRPIVLAREAAMRAIETMKPEDYIGVLTFTDQFSWDVPVHQLGSGLGLRQVLDTLSQVEASGGTRMYQAMTEALSVMGNLPPGAPPARHVLILSDGESNDGSLTEFRELAQAAQELKITISTIAFGDQAGKEVMSEIAHAGKGRFYAVTQAGELPRIMIYESQAARSENVQTGQTSLKPGEAGHPILSGLRPSQLPVLSGYNALTSRAKDGAEDVLLSSNFADPILSTWQYGLGRVTAWTADLGQEWTGVWPSPESEGQFWSQIVRYSQASPAIGPAQVNVQVEDTHLAIDASILSAEGTPINLAQVHFTYVDSSGNAHRFSLPQSGAGAYHLEIPLPPQGAYRGMIDYPGQDGRVIEVPAPFAVNPPVEWLPESVATGEQNTAADLQSWAEMTGGRLIPLEEVLLTGQKPDETGTRSGEAGGVRWGQSMLLALVLLWPLEIAIRRRWLPWFFARL